MIQRLHTTDNPKLKVRSHPKQQAVGMKPDGLWYGIGTAWIDWMVREGYDQNPDWKDKHTFDIEIVSSKILILTTTKEFLDFEREFSTRDTILGSLYPMIDWQKVADRHSGIEIQKYFREFRHSHKWYYIWDVASGCIWNADAVVSVKKISSAS